MIIIRSFRDGEFRKDPGKILPFYSCDNDRSAPGTFLIGKITPFSRIQRDQALTVLLRIFFRHYPGIGWFSSRQKLCLRRACPKVSQPSFIYSSLRVPFRL